MYTEIPLPAPTVTPLIPEIKVAPETPLVPAEPMQILFELVAVKPLPAPLPIAILLLPVVEADN